MGKNAGALNDRIFDKEKDVADMRAEKDKELRGLREDKERLEFILSDESSKREEAEKKIQEVQCDLKAEKDTVVELQGAHTKALEELKQNKAFEAQLADSIPTKSTAPTQGMGSKRTDNNNSKISFAEQDELITSKATVRDVSQSRSLSPRNAALNVGLSSAPAVRRSTRNLREATQ